MARVIVLTRCVAPCITSQLRFNLATVEQISGGLLITATTDVDRASLSSVNVRSLVVHSYRPLRQPTQTVGDCLSLCRQVWLARAQLKTRKLHWQMAAT